MSIELLVREISAISKKHELINRKTGKDFNVFKIVNIASNEVAICRVLYELLSPTGRHYHGTTYLKLFVQKVLKIEMLETELASAIVYREYTIDENRRIDLVINMREHFIPIEVKVSKTEQPNQCYDYYQKAINSNLFYLTPFGDFPSDYSANDLTDEQITSISFSEDILNWLDECLKQKETIKTAPIREVILQYMSAIRSFTNNMGDEKGMEIKNLLMGSSDNMKSAIAIESSVIDCKVALMEKLLTAIEEKVSRKKIINEFDYAYNDYEKINKLYRRKTTTLPGISYLYKEAVKPHVDIWVRIEIDYDMYVGYVCAYDNKFGKQHLSEIEIMNHIDGIEEPCIEDWWAYYEILPDDHSTKRPNFRDANDPYIKLYDKDYFDDFVSICVKKINKFLHNPISLRESLL